MVAKKTSPSKTDTSTVKFALVNYWKDYVGWGRARRSEYWWVVLFYGFLFSIVMSITTLILGYIFGFLFGRAGINFVAALDWLVSWGWWGATLVPGFCLAARRLHDTNRSAWNLCWAILPIVGWILLIVFMCQEGDAKSNRFGAPRK